MNATLKDAKPFLEKSLDNGIELENGFKEAGDDNQDSHDANDQKVIIQYKDSY